MLKAYRANSWTSPIKKRTRMNCCLILPLCQRLSQIKSITKVGLPRLRSATRIPWRISHQKLARIIKISGPVTDWAGNSAGSRLGKNSPKPASSRSIITQSCGTRELQHRVDEPITWSVAVFSVLQANPHPRPQMTSVWMNAKWKGRVYVWQLAPI